MAGVFETIRVRGGRVPLLAAHLDRLAAGLAALKLGPPPPGLADRVLRLRGAGDLVVRVTIDESGERIETRPVPAAGPLRVVFSGTFHEPYPHKRTDRAVFDRARERVVPYRADEVLLLTRDGYLAEGCITSVFFWLGTELCTPTLELGILPGVGRARLIEMARARGLAVREGCFTRAMVEGLPLLLVNAVRGVLETAVQGEWHPPPDDRTRLLAEAFWG